MTKLKKLCYSCNAFRYLRGFTGVGKKKNKICNLCLFKDSRKPLFLTDEELEEKNQPINPKKLTANELNEGLAKGGYWFEEDTEE